MFNCLIVIKLKLKIKIKRKLFVMIGEYFFIEYFFKLVINGFGDLFVGI